MMFNNKIEYKLTQEDRQKYSAEVLKVDLSETDDILDQVPNKLKRMLSTVGLHPFQVDLLSDVSRLYTVLSESSNLDEDLRKWIIFGLKYFFDSKGDIHDHVPDIGYLDDAVVVRWVIDQTMLTYPDHFDG